MRPQIEDAIRRGGLERQVKIIGWVSGERVRTEISAARALILPSFSENMPVVIMEAMALGRPIISTYVAGIPELVRPGETGWLVAAGDETALFEAMREALAAPVEQLTAMGIAGRARSRNATTRSKKRGSSRISSKAVGWGRQLTQLVRANYELLR